MESGSFGQLKIIARIPTEDALRECFINPIGIICFFLNFRASPCPLADNTFYQLGFIILLYLIEEL
jgi:hypothetical protein